MKKLAICVLFILAGIQVAAAQIITSISGPPAGVPAYSTTYDEYLAQSWTSTGAYNNVAISAELTAYGSSLPVDAYLLTAIGPSATPADVVASTSLNVPEGNTSLLSVFSGLDLSAGTYYLLFSGSADLVGWDFTPNSGITTGPGTTENSGLYSGVLDTSFAPDSTFLNYSDTTDSGIMLVTGDPVSSVTPEPSSLMLLGTGVLGVAGALRRRWMKASILS